MAADQDEIKEGSIDELKSIPGQVDKLREEQTQRKQLKKVQEDNAAPYRSLVENASDGIAVICEGKFVYLNQAMARLLGANRVEEINGKPVLDFVHPDFKQIVCERMHQVYEEGKIAPRLEEKLIRLDGKVIEAEVAGIPTTYQEKLAIQVICRDITQRKKAEEKIAHLYRIYSLLSKINEAIIRIRDRERLFREVCRIAIEQGLFRMAWIGIIDSTTLEVKPIVHYGVNAGYLEQIKISLSDTPKGCRPTIKAIRKGKHFICNNLKYNECKLPWRAEAIERGYHSFSVFPLRVGKRVIGVFTMYAAEQDFFDDQEVQLLEELAANISFALESIEQETQRRLAEKALRDSEKRYSTLFEESKDVVYISTPDGRLLDINPAGVELFGYASKEELLKIDIARDIYYNPKDRDMYRNALEKNGFVKDYEIAIKRKDGEKLIVLVTATAVRDEKGSIVAYQGIIRDVTEQKKLEQQLLQAQKMEAVGLLAGGVAHDFNNLLTVILGNAELCLSRLNPLDPIYVKLSRIQQAAQTATALTQRLLAFSRKQILQPRVSNVADLVTNLSKMLSRLIGEDIELKLEFAPDLGKVYADPTALEQVLMNLAVNSRDAMPNGGILTIRAQNVHLDESFCYHYPDAKPGDYVKISVEDTGIGMDEQTLQRIFEPFFTTKEQGTGLGLSVVYGILKQQEGFITASSQLGKGSRFDIYLPFNRTHEIPELPKSPSGEIPRGIETILVAEDEEMLRELLKAFLEELGYQVLLARDGEEALKMFVRDPNHIDLVILDAVMPRLSGLKAYEQMCATHPNVGCLLITGYSEGIIRRYMDGGLDIPLLHKPINFRDLGQKIRELLDQRISKVEK
jgi:PAS domain S-box-containing protein